MNNFKGKLCTIILGFIIILAPVLSLFSQNVHAESLNEQYANQSVEQFSPEDGTLSPMIPVPEHNDQYSAAAVAKVGNIWFELGQWFAQTAIDGIRNSHNWSYVEDLYKLATELEHKNQKKYYTVRFDFSNKGRLEANNVMTLDEVIVYIQDQNKNGVLPNIWTPSGDGAITLARKLSPLKKPIGSENEAKGNNANKTLVYYNHYHEGTKNKTQHIFYGQYATAPDGAAGPFSVDPEVYSQDELE